MTQFKKCVTLIKCFHVGNIDSWKKMVFWYQVILETPNKILKTHEIKWMLTITNNKICDNYTSAFPSIQPNEAQ